MKKLEEKMRAIMLSHKHPFPTHARRGESGKNIVTDTVWTVDIMPASIALAELARKEADEKIEKFFDWLSQNTTLNTIALRRHYELFKQQS